MLCMAIRLYFDKVNDYRRYYLIKRSKPILFTLSKLLTFIFLILLLLIPMLIISSSLTLADDPVQTSDAAKAPVHPWFEPQTMVQVYTDLSDTDWHTIPYASVLWGVEFFFEERLYHIDADGWVRVNNRVIADAASLAEANRPYDPDNWRFVTPEDLVRFIDQENYHVRHGLADTVTGGNRFWFQGILYQVTPDPTDSAFVFVEVTDYVLSEDKQMMRLETWLLLHSHPSDPMLGSPVSHLPSNGLLGSPVSRPPSNGLLDSGQVASSGSSLTDFDFAGKRLENFGLLDFEGRYYSPLLGRFISPDPIVPNYSNPQALNRYSYAYNNPLKYTDPSGHCGVLAGSGNAGVPLREMCLMAGAAAVAGSAWLGTNQFDLDVDLDVKLNWPSSGGDELEIGNVMVFPRDFGFQDAGDYPTITLDTPEIPLILPFPSNPPDILDEDVGVSSSVSPELTQPYFTSITANKPIIPLGRASTGRTTPKTLSEQLAMEEVMSNPQGIQLSVPITDPRWSESGWTKWAQNVNGVEIHYLYNQETGEYDDFKFK